MMDKSSKAALNAMRQARDFPVNTCAASRHAALMAESLMRREPYPMLADEPEHCGESIACAVAALWRARAALKAAEEDAALWEERARHLGWRQAPNVEFSGAPAGHSSNHPAGGTSAGTQG